MTLVVGDYSIKNRGSGAAFDMPRYEMRRTGAISKRQRSNHSGRKDQKRKEKPKISKEELDRELEEYMSNRKNAQKEDTAEADQSGLTETLELLSGSQKTAEDNRKSPVVECSSSSNSTETKETPKDDIDMEIDADLEALMQN
ncbi:hypothetical protein L596_000769 [Steinernema carpocapsae]|uniref:Chromatin target of PRMT1 protein C-terminal domain-containing protein n=1 Tax=Steinernema carpocapsae TaxID=34508 RepID=A0A4U8ULF4_STECR|nr:hypothetical protein L596_000769 [Steinernema carpocapsae]